MLFITLPIAGYAAVRVGGDAPSAALGSDLLWRVEIAGLTLLAAYLPIMTMWLAYQGRWLELEVPPGAGAKKGDPVDDAEAMGSAATRLEQVGADINRRLDLQAQDIRELADRVARLEGD